MQNKAVVYKYSVKLMWPAMCRNRSVEILKDRPDLVDQDLYYSVVQGFMDKFARSGSTSSGGIFAAD